LYQFFHISTVCIPINSFECFQPNLLSQCLVLPNHQVPDFVALGKKVCVFAKKYGEQFLALINTLRTNDFQEPEYKKVAQVELEYETSKPKQPDAHLLSQCLVLPNHQVLDFVALGKKVCVFAHR
jgi:hypothetical protein